MASVYLQGGPCNGRTVPLTPAEADAGELYCGGDVYKNPYTGQRRRGLLVFTDAGKIPNVGGGGGGTFNVYQSNVWKSWSDIERSVNRNLPTALHKITVTQTRILQALAHKRRVRN